MEYLLKNGKNVVIRKPKPEDAESIINVRSIAYTETPFLARNPGEFSTPVKREIITNILNDNDVEWFVAVYEDKVIGQCSVGLVRKNERYRHRAEVAFVILKEYWNLGIGGKMIKLSQCIEILVLKLLVQFQMHYVIKMEPMLMNIS